MTTVSLHNLNRNLKQGVMTLTGRTGIHYRNAALEVPGYGWVPCSMKLQKHFTTDSSQLMLVISDSDDANRPVTSDIWVTRSNIVTIY